MKNNNEKYTLKEIADMCGLTLEEAISDVCECDLMYGQSCDYHKNPDMQATLNEWREMSTQGDQYGISQSTRFYPVKTSDKASEVQNVL